MNIKPRTYYNVYDNTEVCDYNGYDIVYTGTKWVYRIAYQYDDEPLIKYTKKYKWGTIKEWQYYIKKQKLKVEEISKSDVFLELL